MYVGVDKFYPPQVGGPKFLFRQRVVDNLIRRCSRQKPIIVFEAQAGQGKTTVIKQFLDRLGGDSAWYQVTPEDADPANLLAALQACLSQGCPEQPEIADIPRWTAGNISCYNLPKHLARLLGQVRSHLANDLYLVFDDLHHLAGHEESVFLINHLIATAPPRLRFILSSREPVRLQALAHSGESASVARVGNRELALEDSEIADLFHQVFGGALSHSMIREISIKTDGWIMGALLFGLQMVSRGDAEPLGSWDGARCSDIRAYFRRKVFALLEPELRHPLLVLSLLEDIPVDLAAGLTGREDIHARLHQLAARNFFIRDLTPDSTVFGLHHLFRQFLRDKAAQELAPETLRKVHRDAGAYYLRCNTPAQALRHYLKAGDLEAIDAALREQGPAMLAANQTATLSSILGSIPEQDLARLGWGCLFLALATMDSAPANALPLLRKALAVFAPAHDELGELVCLAHIISIHITTTGHSREGEQLLERAEELFQGLEGGIDSCTTILIARSMAMGRVIFLADVDTATRYADMAMSLAMKDHLVNFEAAMLMVMGYIKIFAGHLSMARQWMERAHEIVPRSEVGAFHCLAIRMMLMNFLFHDGCFDNYYTEKSQIVDAVGMDMFSQSIVGPFCHVWEMDIAINQGRFEEALRIAKEADALSPHLKSQTLQLKAVVLALQGQAAEALAACDESTRLREQAGGLYFITLQKIVGGLIHGFCGEYDVAVSMLTEGIQKARSMPTDYLESCGLMHRAATFLLRGECEAATADIRRGLGLMRRNDYKHFWAWTPGSMEQVLGFAVSRNIEPAYARKLAVEHIRHDFTDQGESIPLLEVRCLGELAILFRGERVLPPEALTQGQRELLCLLLASPDLKIPQDTACLHFWPDGSPLATRTNFDTMMSRLRKSFAEVLPQSLAGRYLFRERGMVWLANCRVDALLFLEEAKKGQEHSRLQQRWQAANAFSRAAALWKGEFAPGVTGEDRIGAFRHELTTALARLALTWGGHLDRINRTQAAIDIVEKALRPDPLNDSLWALLYRLHGRRSVLQARQVVNRLATVLRNEGYPEADIEQILTGVTVAP
ncbi:BTAD domain-containing putative transcriptional regulator [Desulfolutivibrio sulfoxidireducens]|uniref:BTAD domain-containing putative transcriptional regulator n=1 Tax=Desulfolutivibrio sulfoxidireducens TaxID=2773299 RepID=UPI001C4019BD|nr:BTAD domain-containing putative transcriptional regulator [Desulfolutivibrio sulfoxidireducens]